MYLFIFKSKYIHMVKTLNVTEKAKKEAFLP